MATRIGLISDTHIPEARNELWPQVFRAFQDVDYIFHGGDVHDLSLLDELEKLAQVYCARGNGEDGSGGRPIQPEDPRVKYSWTVELEDQLIGLTHYVSVDEGDSQFNFKRSVEQYFPEERPDVIVYGDTHVELITVVDGVLVVNPGSPTYPHNYDTQYGTLGFLELDRDTEPKASVWQIVENGIEPFKWDEIPPWRRR